MAMLLSLARRPSRSGISRRNCLLIGTFVWKAGGPKVAGVTCVLMVDPRHKVVCVAWNETQASWEGALGHCLLANVDE